MLERSPSSFELRRRARRSVDGNAIGFVRGAVLGVAKDSVNRGSLRRVGLEGPVCPQQNCKEKAHPGYNAKYAKYSFKALKCQRRWRRTTQARLLEAMFPGLAMLLPRWRTGFHGVLNQNARCERNAHL
jgi:hypothetical protein